MADELETKLDALLKGIGSLTETIKESKKTDGGREAAAQDGRAELAAKAAAVNDQKEDEQALKAAKVQRELMAEVATEAIQKVLKDTRSPSLAAAIGSGRVAPEQANRLIKGVGNPPSEYLKSIFTDYQAGELFGAIGDFTAARKWMDMDLAQDAKGRLAELGVFHNDAPDTPGGVHLIDSEGRKATTGATGATGGYVLPNNLVDTVVKPATQRAVLQQLVTVRNGVNVRGVDQPFRTGAPTRMAFQDWNTSKENVNEAYGSYTAYLGTIARVMDITKQYARFSGGSAEADVVDELTRAAILGENYYMVAGAGTGTVGSGDPTTGIYTALTAVGQVAYHTTPSSAASNSTVAGSFAAILTQINAALAARSRENTGVLVDATTYWTMFQQGSDNAGFFMSDFLGAGFSIGADNTVRWRGTPIFYDVNLGTAATTKIAIAGEWRELKLYRGLEFRIDSSDVAGTRWDYNLIGFRGEEEIGFNALTGVAVGAFQYATAVIP